MKARVFIALAALVAFVTRLPFLPAVEQDLDSSRFVRALARFDLAQGHPHPPGYPVFIAAGHVAQCFVTHDAAALALVSAVAFAAAVAAVASLAHDVARSKVAVGVASLVLALGTSASVHSARPLSDMCGCALAWCALAVLRADTPRRRVLAGMLVGLVAGARLSTLPLVLPAVVWVLVRAPSTQRWVVARSLVTWPVVVAAVCYAPVVWSVGAGPFVALVTGHAEGHFTRFGGTAFTASNPFARLGAFVFGLHAHVLGGWWPDRSPTLLASTLAVAALVLVGARAWWREGHDRMLLGCCAVYALWALAGQNVLWQPRHLLPLASAFALFAGFGAARLPRRVRYALALSLVPLVFESARVLRVQATTPPPTLVLAQTIARRCDPTRSIVATAQLGTWLRYRLPAYRVVELRHGEEALALARRYGLAVCATSELAGVSAPPWRFVDRVRGDRYVWSTLYDLALWKASPPFGVE